MNKGKYNKKMLKKKTKKVQTNFTHIWTVQENVDIIQALNTAD